MPKKTALSRKEYKKLSDILRLAKYKHSSRLARVILEAWVCGDGRIDSDLFVREGVCSKGKFTILRKQLIKDQFVVFDEETKRYFAGFRLIPYINELMEMKNATLADLYALAEKKADRRELKDAIAETKAELSQKADKAELEFTKFQLEETQKRMEEIAEAVKELQKATEPPDTPQKRLIVKKNAAKLAGLVINH